MADIKWNKVRKWAYGVSVAAVPLGVYFGLLEPEATPVILPLLLAFFNVNEDTED